MEGVKLNLPTSYVNDAIEFGETIVNDMPSKPIIEHGGESHIQLEGGMQRYSTELANATGHRSRLHREELWEGFIFGSNLTWSIVIMKKLITWRS